jgi:hypothetical protein
MTEPLIFQIITRAADDPQFLREMLADPGADVTARDLTLPERDLLDRLGAYDLTRVNRLALTDVENLMVEFMRLRIASSLTAPDVYAFLLERAEELSRAMARLEIERLQEEVEERRQAEACADGIRTLDVILVAIAVLVAMSRLFAEDNDPE